MNRDPVVGAPVTLPFTNKFDLAAGQITSITVAFDLLYDLTEGIAAAWNLQTFCPASPATSGCCDFCAFLTARSSVWWPPFRKIVLRLHGPLTDANQHSPKAWYGGANSCSWCSSLGGPLLLLLGEV